MRHVDMGGPVPAHAPTLGPCWLWTGAVADNGYGEFRVGDRVEYAHRFAYTHTVGPIPDGHHVDHLCHHWTTCEVDDVPCEHRRCVNPMHLDAVTATVNNARSNSPTAVNARKACCDSGHLFTPANTYIHPVRRTRHCRTCQRDNAARYERRRRMLVASAEKRRASRVPGPGQGALFTPEAGVPTAPPG